MTPRYVDLRCVRIIATTLLGLVAAAGAAPSPAAPPQTYDTPLKKTHVPAAAMVRPVPPRDADRATPSRVPTPASDRSGAPASDRHTSSKDSEALQSIVRALESRLAATSDATDRSTEALANERNARARAERDAQRLRAAIDQLQSELLAAQRENSGLHQEVAQLGKQLSASDLARAGARQTIRALNSRIASIAPELQTTRDALTATQAAAQDATRRADASAARGAASENALARLRKELALWVAGAALLGAGAGGIAARAAAPRPNPVVKPMSVSVRLGEWAVASETLHAAATPPFRIRSLWLPGRSDVAPAAQLVRRPSIATLHGKAA